MMLRILFAVVMMGGMSTQVSAVEIQRWQTDEGSTITLVERHELPIVNMQLTFKGAGKIADVKTDVATATASSLVAGTAQYSEEALRDESNRLGINISGNAGVENAHIYLSSLSRSATLQPAVALLNQVVASPQFPRDVWQREQQKAITALKQQESSPAFVGSRALNIMNYGQHPYANGSRSSEASIRAVTPEDMASFHRQHYAKNNAYITIVGDVSRHQAEQLTAAALKGLPDKMAVNPAIPPVENRMGSVQDIPFAGKEQAVVLMGLPLIVRQDPDRFALTVGNYILGEGGFDSRLMKTLRDEQGLVYGVSSDLTPFSEKGPFNIAFSTQKGKADAALVATQKVLADFIAQGPTEAELQQAKDHIIGSFPLKFDTNAKVLPYAANVGIYHLPLDYLNTYTQGIQAVTVEQVKEVWQRRLNMQQINVVVVGKTQQ